MTENDGFRPSSGKYSRNPLQTRCVHLLCECSELICFLATLAKFRPSCDHEITENGGFRPSSEKVSLCGIMITIIMNYSIYFKYDVHTD